MLDDVKKRLADFGYTATDEDGWVLEFVIGKVENHIKNQCNTQTIPEGLYKIAMDMAVGEFLLCKKNTGKLSGFDLDAAVSSISEGDVSITYAIGNGSLTPEERLDKLIDYLIHPRADFIAYRCLKW